MKDINGKTLHINSDIHTYAYGMLKILSIEEEHNPDKGGALIQASEPKPNGKVYTLRTHEANVRLVRTWKELAKLALGVQDACNLSGVVHSFSDIITEVRARLDSEGKGGTDNVNHHPVCVLFASKIGSLANSESTRAFREAFEWATEETSK